MASLEATATADAQEIMRSPRRCRGCDDGLNLPKSRSVAVRGGPTVRGGPNAVGEGSPGLWPSVSLFLHILLVVVLGVGLYPRHLFCGFRSSPGFQKQSRRAIAGIAMLAAKLIPQVPLPAN